MKIFHTEDYTGGGTRAIDSISGGGGTNQYSDGDIVITVTVSGGLDFHKYVASGTAAENSPAIIRPDDYGTYGGNWIQGTIGQVFGPGTMPSGVTKTGDMVGGVYAVNSSDPDHDTDFTYLVCLDSTNAAKISHTGTMTKRIDAAWVAGSNQGGMLNGAVAADKTYRLFALLKDSDASVDFGHLLLTDAIGSYLPSGYSKYIWLGYAFTDSSSNIIGYTFLPDGTMLFNEADTVRVLDTYTNASFASIEATLDNYVGGSECLVRFGTRSTSGGTTISSFYLSYDGTNSVEYYSGRYISDWAATGAHAWSSSFNDGSGSGHHSIVGLQAKQDAATCHVFLRSLKLLR